MLLAPCVFYVFWVISGCSAQTVASNASVPLVTLDFGTFLGVRNSQTKTDIFYGLPFAAPPVGSLRLREPQPLNISYTGVQNATTPKADCPQQNSDVPLAPILLEIVEQLNLESAFATPTATSENCLYLDVVRPSTANSSSNLPVLFWIYGGGFETGGISQYDGTPFVAQSIAMAQEVIWVSANYRLSGWGFMPGQEIQDAGLGNIGLLDQRAALLWVQKHISAFGGDPTKVTIWGQSAGSSSVFMQMLLYGGETNNTFRAGIMESGQSLTVGPLSNGQPVFDQIVSSTNCSAASDKLDCLRSLNETDFAAAVLRTPQIFTAYRGHDLAFEPRVDGKTLLDTPINLLSQGRYANIPIIAGDVADEGTLFEFGATNVTTDADFVGYLAGYFPSISNATLNALLTQYPSDPALGSPFHTGDLYAYTPENKRIAAIVGDLFFNGPRRYVSEFWVNASLPVFSYLFTYTDTTPYLGAYHGSELAFMYSEVPYTVGLQMRAAWIAFTNSLDPNAIRGYAGGLGLPHWPKYGHDAKQMNFGPNGTSVILDTYRKNGTAIFVNNPEEFIE